MLKAILSAVAVSTAVAAAPAAHASNVGWSVSLGLPGLGFAVGAPAYSHHVTGYGYVGAPAYYAPAYAPAPVYYAPPPVAYPAPVYYAPPAPRVAYAYRPAPVVYGPPVARPYYPPVAAVGYYGGYAYRR